MYIAFFSFSLDSRFSKIFNFMYKLVNMLRLGIFNGTHLGGVHFESAEFQN